MRIYEITDEFGKPTPSPEQLAKKWKVPIEIVKNQIIRGIEVELEHTFDRKIAAEIARDHINEYLYYYRDLANMEKKELINLSEINSVGLTDISDFGLTEEEIESSKEVSSVMQIPLFRFEKGGVTYFFLLFEDQVIAWTKGYVYAYTNTGDLAFLVKKSKVDVNHRNKGLMTGIYYTINEHLKLSIISDNEQSLDAQKLWKNIYTQNKNRIKKYNSETGQIEKINDISELYGNKEWHFLLELTENMKRMYGYLKEDKLKPISDLVKYPSNAYDGTI